MIPSCEEVTQLVSESMDRKLPMGKRIAVRIHFLMCKFCRRFNHQLLFIRKAGQQYKDKATEEREQYEHSLSPEAAERIKQSLKSNQE
jgi:Mn-dependent DtxR family transcriptional regulator